MTAVATKSTLPAAYEAFNVACIQALETFHNGPLLERWYEETKARFAAFNEIVEASFADESQIAIGRAHVDLGMARVEVLFAMHNKNGPLFTRWMQCVREREKRFNGLIEGRVRAAE